MSTEKAREALDGFQFVESDNGNAVTLTPIAIAALLERLKPYLIPDGCEVICGVCKATKADWPEAKHNGGNCNSYNHVENGEPCPFKPDTKATQPKT